MSLPKGGVGRPVSSIPHALYPIGAAAALLALICAVWQSVGGMEGISWLLFSWGLVAALCYFALNKLGLTDGQGEERKHVGASAASPTGSNSANADWTNEVISWLYNNFHKVPGPLEAWIKSLNDAAKKVTSPTKCEILFEGFGDHSNAAHAPKFSQVRVEQGPRDHLTLRSHVHLPSCKLRLVSSQRTPERMLVSNYEANIVDLRGEVEGRLACIAGQLYVMACFNGRPEMEVELRNTDTHSTSEVNREMVEEAIRRCLLSAVTNINLSEQTGGHVGDSWNRDMSPAHAVGELFRTMNQHANASPYHSGGSRSHSPNRSNASPTVLQSSVHNYSFDRPDSAAAHHRETSGHSAHHPTQTGVQRESSFREAGLSGSHNEPVLRDASPTHHATDMFKRLNQSNLMTPAMNNSTVPNKLRVTVIKANRLGKGVEVQQPFIVIEMDEPASRHQTSKGINMSPYWEETFDFELTPASEEILFEAYEGASGAVAANEKHFLGLAIVNFEEIRRSGETVHQLRLQGRPYRNDVVQGDLTVQFDFYFDPSVQSAGKITDKVVVRAPNGAEFCETVTTTRRPIYDPHDTMDVPEVIPTKTTTVTVKTVSHSLKEKPMISSVHGSMENAVDPHTQHILDQTFNRQYITEALSKDRSLEQRDFEPVMELQPNIHSGNEPLRMHNNQEKMELTVHNPVEGAFNERQSRDRSKRGGAPGEKRESSFFGQLRDRLSGRRKSQKRSKSVDMHAAEIEEAVSLPPSRDQSRTRYSEGPRSLYETTSVGGKSGHSTRSLYQHSTLVLELAQKDGNKYFLIPPSMLTEPAAAKLMRRGKKLHVYNEHTFVAVKIRGGASCNVCNGRINRSFSKQAYQCRDCKMICHKSCHYKTDAFCTQSTVSKLQIAKDVDWAHFLSHTQLEEFISFEGI